MAHGAGDRTIGRVTIERMDHVGVVVEDLAAAIAFFEALGLELAGEASVSGEWVGRVIALDAVSSRIAMLRTPDGHSQIELTEFQTPPAVAGDREAATNVTGIRHVTFAVDDLDATLERIRAHGAELVGELAQYADSYRLCYVRGPAGIIVELAQRIG
jgi:catechol 2,3-dioxygenase-like lactoylglutathione lyase family enzyme